MIEPTSQAAAFAASLSAITLALLGVDHLSIIYGLVGALFALYEAERMERGRAMVFVVLSTLAGAAMGNGALALLGSGSKGVLLVSCIVCGYGTQALLARLLRRGLNQIDKDDGGKTP
jgi:crotonobetainyl-CoA:carnitine CoA-transferase CaiB-like acyl-CoA transferase